MKVIGYFVIAVFLFLNLPILIAQDLHQKLDAVYGMSPVLYNGVVYSDYYNNGVKGDQFLDGGLFKIGNLTLNNASFTSLELNYDIYRQKLLLQFETQNLAKRQIEIPLEHTKRFSIDDKDYQIIQNNDSSFKIFQVIGDGNHKILIHHYKTLRTASSSVYKYHFSERQHKTWLQKEDQIHRIKSNKQFANYFPKDKNLIKSWLKSNKIKLKKASDPQFSELINYINSL